MRVVRMADVPIDGSSPSIRTGDNITIQLLAPDSRDFVTKLVSFGKGVQNKPHVHKSDQLLIVTAGKGIVATDQEQVEVQEGDVIFSPAGERHWHGAAAGSDFANISILLPETSA